MSLLTGGRLQAAGQVRNTYDILTQSDSVNISWSSGSTVFTAINPRNALIPFDIGPDKASRVFLRVHGVEAIIQADSYVGNPTLDGWLYYEMPNGKRIYLKAIKQALTASVALSCDRVFFPDYSYNAESVKDFGSLGFENNASALGGTATAISILCRVNYGLYGIYSEPDYDQLNRIPDHEHTGLPMLSYDED